MKTLISPIIVLFFAAFATPAIAAVPVPPPGDGRLSLFNYHEGEYLDVTYRQGRSFLPEGLKKIEHLLRSRGDGAVHFIDLRLIELLDAIQDHFGAETVEVISGYRSPAYNRSLVKEGRGAASESLHLKGLAADIHLDEVTEEALFDYARKLGIGGVGIYPRYGFVHVDVGPPRMWREAAPSERVLIGTENNPNPAWSAVTEKNTYARGEALAVKITNNSYRSARLILNVWTEHFRKGAWSDQQRLEQKPSTVSLEPGASTIYAWSIPQDAALGKYRLVIFTSRDFSVPPAYSNEFYIRK